MSIELIKRVLSTISGNAMFRAGDRVGVGVSGGSDSVALLRILHDLSKDQGIALTVLHFNHRLRGAESDADERFVAGLAAELNLPFFSGRKDVACVARAKHWNLEEAGRRLRYEFFTDLAGEVRIDRVAVGHTADDQAETVLARIVRGAAPAGLAAIYPVNGRVIRPLIEARRTELREYLESAGQPWREDASNYDLSRLRARLRHQILPLLEGEIQHGVVGHLGQLAARSREDEVFWRALTCKLARSLVEREGNRVRIRSADLLDASSRGRHLGLELPDVARLAVARRLVRRVIEELRGHCRQWTADHVERVIQLAATGSSGSCLELPGVVVERSFEWLCFSRAEERTKEYDSASERDSGVGPAFLHSVSLGNPGESTAVAVPEIKRRFHLKVVDWHTLGRDTDSDKAALDRDLLGSPLVLRNWLPGDSFRPKGRRSSRKLKQFFRMKRVAVPDRQGWPVLTSADRVVWTRGLPVAGDFAPRSETRTGVIIVEERL